MADGFRQAGMHYVVAVILVVPKSSTWWMLGGKSLEEPVSESTATTSGMFCDLDRETASAALAAIGMLGGMF